jgi:hypothetical protein
MAHRSRQDEAAASSATHPSSADHPSRAPGHHRRIKISLFPSLRSCRYDPSIARSATNTLNAALRRLGYDKTEPTVHGLRSTASVLLNESGKWETNEVRGAYTHAAEFWQERVRMMRWWADELNRLRELGRVVRIRT